MMTRMDMDCLKTEATIKDIRKQTNPKTDGYAFKTCKDSWQKCYKFHLVPSCGKMIPYQKY